MLVVPKEKPIIAGLNTYYLNIKRLLEHCQGEVGAGGIFFRAVDSQGVIFFDQGDVLNAYLRDRKVEESGDSAVERLINIGSDRNFTVDIYQFSPEDVYFWSSLPTAEKIYKDLSTEFTDLEGLIRKMSAEKLTGFIDVRISGGKDGGLIFISGGEIIGGSYSWRRSTAGNPKTEIDKLIKKTKQDGGTFQVSRIPMDGAPPVKATAEPLPQMDRTVIKMLEEYLNIFETFYQARKKPPLDFNSLMRKKFVENAEKYSFLDPFAAEFEYVDRKITFIGHAGGRELAQGVIQSVEEIVADLGVSAEFRKYLTSWFNKYQKKLSALKIDFQ
jgi:hypothetical protein